jgi:hypothetical protein
MPLREEITYILLHDRMPDHEKIAPLSDAAFRRLVRGWCWCSVNHKDGWMPWVVWCEMAPPTVRTALSEAGLVIHEGDRAVFHDYLDIQRSQAEIQELKDAKSKAGIKGNHRRHHVNKGVRDPECPLCLRGVA